MCKLILFLRHCSYQEPGWHNSSVLVQQCYRLTSKQVSKDGFEGTATLREGETKFKIHEYKNNSHNSESWISPSSVLLLVKWKWNCQHNENAAPPSHSCSCFSAAPISWERLDLTCPYQVTMTEVFFRTWNYTFLYILLTFTFYH